MKILILERETMAKSLQDQMRSGLEREFGKLDITIAEGLDDLKEGWYGEVPSDCDVYLIHDTLINKTQALQKLREKNTSCYVAFRRSINFPKEEDGLANEIGNPLYERGLTERIANHFRQVKVR